MNAGNAGFISNVKTRLKTCLNGIIYSGGIQEVYSSGLCLNPTTASAGCLSKTLNPQLLSYVNKKNVHLHLLLLHPFTIVNSFINVYIQLMY